MARWSFWKAPFLGYVAAVVAGLMTMESMNAAPEPVKSGAKTELATFGGGCFWCSEAVFETFKGVNSVVSGYAGGKEPNPTYEQICSGRSTHAEVVQIAYDPAQISFDQLLEIFWIGHDPTTLNRQGPDSGTQYRSIILYHDEAQKQAAEKSKQAAGKQFTDPIVTEIVKLEKFYPAEEYHQDYYRRNPNKPYCAINITPKLQKLQKLQKARK
jgi:peptide-methionine (S)-S-oxide reductase